MVTEVALAGDEVEVDEAEGESQTEAKVRASGEVLRISTEKLTAEGTEDVETSAEATAGATTEGAYRHHIREREPNVGRVSRILL